MHATSSPLLRFPVRSTCHLRPGPGDTFKARLEGSSVAARKASLRIGFSFAAVGMYLFAKEGFR